MKTLPERAVTTPLWRTFLLTGTYCLGSSIALHRNPGGQGYPTDDLQDGKDHGNNQACSGVTQDAFCFSPMTNGQKKRRWSGHDREIRDQNGSYGESQHNGVVTGILTLKLG